MSSPTTPTLAVVVPCYNEERALPETARVLTEKLAALVRDGRADPASRVYFVDDGSTDGTWPLIESLGADPAVHGIKLSRNRGHQNALLAGLMTVRERADVVISMDADLQDDVGAIDAMLDAWCDGAEIVYGIRHARASDSPFKRHTAGLFYRLMEWMGADTVRQHADYRLMSRRALAALASFGEVNLFLRGIVPLLGFRTATVEYDRAPRLAGESKYPLRRMVSLAADGITSFSIKPLRLVAAVGAVVSTIALLVMAYALVVKLIGETVQGWTFTVVSVWFIGGVQMLSIGIVGEYVGRTYAEVKHRPRYIVERET